MSNLHRRQIWHRVAIALILTYWALAFAVSAWQLSEEGRGESGYLLQLFAPVVAGGLTVLIGGSKTRAVLLGALIGIVDFNVLNAINYPLQPPALRGTLGEVFLRATPIFGGFGGALGFVGALAGRWTILAFPSFQSKDEHETGPARPEGGQR